MQPRLSLIQIIGKNILLTNFTIKSCLFGATGVKSNDKEKWVHIGYRRLFHEKVEWSFGNDYARNVVNFSIGNSSSSHVDNRKNKFLVLGEGDTFGINASFGAPEKKFSINFSKVKNKILLKFAL